MEMTAQRWTTIARYLSEVFGREDAHLATLMDRAEAAGIPRIAISSDVGRLLQLLASMSGPGGGGARVAVEVGTLAGYSAIWLARGLAPGGVLYTVEADPAHAAFARAALRDAGVADRVRVIEGSAPGALIPLARELGPDSVDLVFLDAVKTQYADYLRALRPCLRVGGILLADNVIGSSWFIGDPPGSSAERDAMDAFSRSVASDPGFLAAAVASREGVLIARRVR